MSDAFKITGPLAESIFSQLVWTKCKHCEDVWLPHEIYAYEHSNGWVVKGYAARQWLFIICPKCGFQWSLWKLGYAQQPNCFGEYSSCLDEERCKCLYKADCMHEEID
jgi:hypothetical protein